jgi:hypothetical protein
MSTERVSQTELASRLQVSRQAINKAIREGKLIKHGSGRSAYIDMKCPLTKAYIKNGTDSRFRPGKAKKKPAPRKPGTKPKAPEPTAEQEKSSGPSDEYQESLSFMKEKVSTDRRKKEQEIEKLTLHNRERRGELIEREVVQMFINKLYEIDNGQWKTLGLKIASDVAAEFGTDDDVVIRKACDVIDREVLRVLKQIKHEQKEFLRKIGIERKAEAKKEKAKAA